MSSVLYQLSYAAQKPNSRLALNEQMTAFEQATI